MSIVVTAAAAQGSVGASSPPPFPVQGTYMLRQLDSLTRDNWARVAGRDVGLPPHVNGHDEFVTAWTREITYRLRGLHASVVRQTFPASGFLGLPATKSGVNVIVAVPGSQDPDRAVVIGAHPDGEPFSRGSAFDDASGCVITLGLARIMGALWRSFGPPALTVEFVLFDAEEEGLIGSSAYGFAELHGAAMPRPLVMIDEEQSGIGYPARPFGLLNSAPMPSYAITTPHAASFMTRVYGAQSRSPLRADDDKLLHQVESARATVFAQLHAAYPSLLYRGGSAGTFGPADKKFLQIGAIEQCCSDNDPFAALGVPSLTLSGDYSYYRRDHSSWAFPFDQPQDTLTAMACDSGGSATPGAALAAALDLPVAISVALLDVYAPATRGPSGVTVISSAPAAGQVSEFHAVGVSDARWSFGDGSTARGVAAGHTYARAGTYRVTLRVKGISRSWQLVISRRLPPFHNPFADLHTPSIRPWHPPELQNVPGCP